MAKGKNSGEEKTDKKKTLILVREDTWKYLNVRRNINESFDDVIKRLIKIEGNNNEENTNSIEENHSQTDKNLTKCLKEENGRAKKSRKLA